MNGTSSVINTSTQQALSQIEPQLQASGRDKIIFMNCKRIGMRKTLVFYTEQAPHGPKREWIMHEYCLDAKEKLQVNVIPDANIWGRLQVLQVI